MGLSFEDVVGDAPHDKSSHDRHDYASSGSAQQFLTQDTEDGQLQRISQSFPELPQITLSWALVDPLFQDIHRTSRLYITHCMSPQTTFLN